jgi:hypothetical protein
VRREKSKKRKSARTLDGIVEGKDVNALSVLDVVASVNGGNVTKLNAEVVTSD